MHACCPPLRLPELLSVESSPILPCMHYLVFFFELWNSAQLPPPPPHTHILAHLVLSIRSLSHLPEPLWQKYPPPLQMHIQLYLGYCITVHVFNANLLFYKQFLIFFPYLIVYLAMGNHTLSLPTTKSFVEIFFNYFNYSFCELSNSVSVNVVRFLSDITPHLFVVSWV